MSKVAIEGNASGTGTFTVAAPNSNTNRTLTLPDNSGVLLSNATTAGFPAGSVLQVASTTKLDAFTTTSLTPVDITGLSVSITPSSATSKILVFSHVFLSSNATSGGYLNLVRNSTALSVGTAGSVNSTFSSWEQNSALWGSIPAMFLDSPNTTSATTYKVQTFVSGGTVYINRRGSDTAIGGSASITVMEIAA